MHHYSGCLSFVLFFNIFIRVTHPSNTPVTLEKKINEMKLKIGNIPNFKVANYFQSDSVLNLSQHREKCSKHICF